MPDDMGVHSRTFWSISPGKNTFKQNHLSSGPIKVTSSIFNSKNTLLKILFYYHSGTSYCLHKFILLTFVFSRRESKIRYFQICGAGA